VSPQVALELIGAGKTLSTKEPLAAKRTFSGMPTEMGLQVARLAVDLSTTRNVTQVLLLLCWSGVTN